MLRPGSNSVLMRNSGVWVQVIFLVLLLGAWYLGANVFGVPALLLPDPATAFHRAIELITDGEIMEPLRLTLFEVATAFAVATISGIVCGYFLSASRFLVAVCDPLLTSINAIPAILFFPLFALLFGLGPGSKIALGITVSFFPIALNTSAGFANVDRTFIRAAQSLGASKWHLMRYVLLPSALPVVVAGLRIGLVLSFLSVIGGETIGSFSGLGHQVADASQAMDPELMYAWIVIVITLSALLNLLLSQIEKRGSRRSWS
jgi:ABC-type nitrate/sulfonate/bicarbonate transport system permease component